MKQVMKVNIFGECFVIKYSPGKDYEYSVWEVPGVGGHIFIDSFESFQEAWTLVEKLLF